MSRGVGAGRSGRRAVASGRDDARRGERGLALVTVVVVLVALVIIATPFALSMRNLESSSLLGFRREQSRAGSEMALAAARRHLEETHPYADLLTPHVDRRDELAPDDLAERFADLLPRDPRGAIRSVSIRDESGKVDLTRATPALLGNLLGGRTVLTAAAGRDDDALTVAGTAGFADAGLAIVGREQIEYSRRDGQALLEVRRGFPGANLTRSVAADHGRGDEVFDARLLLLRQRTWRVRPGLFEPYRRVDGLKDLALFAEMTYDADTLDRVRPHLTIHGGPPVWRHAQRVLSIQPRTDGAVDVLVPDGSHMGAGSVVRLTTAEGQRAFDLVIEALPWGDATRLTLLEGVNGGAWTDDTVVSVLAPVAVNVNSASLDVLTALMAHLGRNPVRDLVTELEAVHLALLFNQAPGVEALPALADEALLEGLFSSADLEVAIGVVERLRIAPGDVETSELALAFAGARSLGSVDRVGEPEARLLAELIQAAQPADLEALRAVLDQAVTDGVTTPGHRELILINAVDPFDLRLLGGTAPFAFDSAGVFELSAASSDNLPNGREQARSFAREIVSVAPPGVLARVFSSQADFEAARALGDGGRGWASRPELMASGPGRGWVPSHQELLDRRGGGLAPDDPGVGLDAALALSAEGVDRAGTLVGGRPGPAGPDQPAWVGPATVRSALPDTLHFDEGAPGLTGNGPDGYDSLQGPVRLEADQVQPSVTADLDGRLQPFCVSFWFTPTDITGEAVLFDAGASDVEDRVSLLLRDGELVFRVSDTGFADFRSDWGEGRLPPAGEIRYGFDDGLELVEGVPYHVTALAHGARSSQMALFVDGLARGRRSYTTRLTEDLPSAGGPFIGSSSGQGTTRVRVESTAGFPERGALRIGNELLEYTSRDERTFVVQAAGSSDPFGGRGKRGSFAFEHLAGETVELAGYSRPLVSLYTLQGNGALNGALGAFTLAQVDPARATTPIEVNPQLQGGGFLDQPWEMGTGLDPNAGSIPVAAVDGGSLGQDAFQSGGGHAILFCDYGDDAVFGQSIASEFGFGQWELSPITIDGLPIGGAELVAYTGFANGELTGVSRASAGIPQSIAPNGASPLENASQSWVDATLTSWADSRAFITSFSDHLTSELSVPAQPRVLVIPISVSVNDATDLYEGYHSQLNPDDHYLQIGLDFPEGGGGTEWVRWNTVTASAFVRDDATAVELSLTQLSSQGLNAWDTGVNLGQGAFDAINQQLGFRGQVGTPDSAHPDAELTLPTIAFGGWGISDWDAALGVPGRHDFVTLASFDGEREWNEVNHASTFAPGWETFCLVGMRAPMANRMERSAVEEDANYVIDQYDVDAALREGAVGARLMDEMDLSDEGALLDAVRLWAVDSRRLTRILGGPSGELPSLAPGRLHLGEDFDGRPTPSDVIVDELRFHVAAPPGPLLPPQARYLLADDLDFDEESAALLAVDQILLPHGRLRGARLGKDRMEILGELPQAGGLLLIGEEIVAYAGLDPVDSGAVFLAGRGLYGSSRGHHPARTPVLPLTFWPASPLAAAMGADDAVVPVVDPRAFPPGGGLLWVDDELIGYDERLDDGLGMPLGPGRFAGGLLRGRFGTVPSSHGAGAMVRWMPARLADRALLGQDVPEAHALRLALRAPGALHTDVALKAQLPDPLVELVPRVVFDRRASHHDDPATEAAVVELTPSPQDAGLYRAALGVQAEWLELVLAVRWLPGAFDPLRGASNAWKLAPRVTDVVVEQVQPTLVLEHEEWR